MNRHRRGFTLIEIVMVVVIIGVIAALGASTYTSVRDASDSLAAKPALGAVQVDGRRIVAEVAAETFEPAFPVTLAVDLSAPGLTLTSNLSDGPDVVSIHRLDATTAIYASFGGGTCTVLVDRLVDTPGWGTDSTSEVCLASAYADRVDAITGSTKEPVEL